MNSKLPQQRITSNQDCDLKKNLNAEGRNSNISSNRCIDKSYRPIPFSFKNFAFKSRQVFEVSKGIRNSLFSKFASGKFSNKKISEVDKNGEK